MTLNLRASAADLAVALVDLRSESGEEQRIADEVEAALRGVEGLRVDRDGDAVVARTSLRRAERVVLAGHLDTVPVADNLPARLERGRIAGCGTTDMKSGVAVLLRLAATLRDPAYDLTFVCYDNEEVEASRNGLGRLAAAHREWLGGDLAVLLEPTAGRIEAGCQGTLRAHVTLTGRRAHSARSWLGENAIHRAAPVLERLAAYQPRSVTIDGCTYREGLNAVRVEGGVAGNVVPDRCTVTVNARFAPDRGVEEALAHVREVLSPHEVTLTDSAPGALPGLAAPATRAFAEAAGQAPVAKQGWTDVARFAALGIPALNYGPGDPDLAHTREEYVEVARIEECERVLRTHLGRR